MKLEKRLVKEITQFRQPFVLALLAGLLTAVLTIVQAALLSDTISQVFLQHRPLSAVSPRLLGYALAGMMRTFTHLAAQHESGTIAQLVKTDLRNRLLSHLFRLGPDYTKSQHTGEISNTLVKGVDALQVYFSQYLPQLFLSALIPAAILIVVFPLDLLSGIIFLLTAPLIPFFMSLIGQKTGALTRKQWRTLSRLSAHFLDILQGLTTLKIFNRSKEQIETIARISDHYRIATMKVLKVAFLSALVLEMVSMISMAIIAVEVGLRLLYAKMDFESALFILLLAPEFYLPFRLLGAKFHAGMEGVAAARCIYEIIEQPVGPPIRNRCNFDLIRDRVRLEAVSHVYLKTTRAVLKSVSFTIEPQQKVALVGPSGSGKTTLTNLLLKFLTVQRGRIVVGNADLNHISASEWRRQLIWISQHPYLFHTSIAKNILLARPEAEPSEMIEAAKHAGIHEFITSLPHQYETLIGEGGIRLSGGEAQRLAQARAFLKKAPFIILDEPTANLDPETEMLIQKSIEELRRHRTILINAHRLHTILDSDQIILLIRGEIREMGTHHELMEKNGLYTRLYKTYRGAA